MTANIVVVSSAVLPQVQSVNGQTGVISLNLSGDVTSPAGSFVSTLATVNSNTGNFGDASHTVTLNLDGKGRVLSASSNSIAIAASQITSGTFAASRMPALTGDVTSAAGSTATTVAKINGVTLGSTTATAGNLLVGSGTQWVSVPASGDVTVASSGAHTLATVNSNVGTFGSSTSAVTLTVNAKGLITGASASAITPSGIGAIANSLVTTTGDIIYASAASTPARLPGAAGVLQSTGAAAPAWTQSPSLTNPTMQAPVMTPQAAPGSPSNGTVWQDSGQNSLSSYEGGLKLWKSGTFFVGTSSVTTSGTTASSWIPTGVGTTTIPANFLVAGKTIRVRAVGSITTAATTGTVSINLTIGSTSLWTSGAQTPQSNLITTPFSLELLITCRAAGTSGTLQLFPWLQYSSGAILAVDTLFGSPVSATLNTTTSGAIAISTTNSVSGGVVFTITNFIIESVA